MRICVSYEKKILHKINFWPGKQLNARNRCECIACSLILFVFSIFKVWALSKAGRFSFRIHASLSKGSWNRASEREKKYNNEISQTRSFIMAVIHFGSDGKDDIAHKFLCVCTKEEIHSCVLKAIKAKRYMYFYSIGKHNRRHSFLMPETYLVYETCSHSY